MCMFCGGVLETIGIGIVLTTIHKFCKRNKGMCKYKLSGENNENVNKLTNLGASNVTIFKKENDKKR